MTTTPLTKPQRRFAAAVWLLLAALLAGSIAKLVMGRRHVVTARVAGELPASLSRGDAEVAVGVAGVEAIQSVGRAWVMQSARDAGVFSVRYAREDGDDRMTVRVTRRSGRWEWEAEAQAGRREECDRLLERVREHLRSTSAKATTLP